MGETPSASGKPTAPQGEQGKSDLPLSPQQASDATCAKLGEGAFTFAQLRDKGVPASQLLASFHDAGLKAGGEEGVVWEKVFRSLILTVYANTWWSPIVARQRMELACLQGREQK